MIDTVTGLYRRTHYVLLILIHVNTDSIQDRTVCVVTPVPHRI